MDYGLVLSGRVLLVPFQYLTDPHSRIFLLYLASSAAIASVLHIIDTRKSKTVSAPLNALVPLQMYTHRSALVDYGYFICNAILYAFLLAPVSFFGTWMSSSVFNGLSALMQPLALVGPPGAGLIALYTIFITCAVDFGTFFAHLLFHRVPLLWEFHKVHHSAEVLTPVTAYRMHPIDDMVTILISGGLAGAVDAFFRFFAAPSMTPYVVYGIGIFTFVFYVIGYNLRHSHVWWSFGPRLSKILISPAQHQIHHSKARKHWDKNFGLIFAIWDWIFGSLYVPVEREQIEFGIGNGEEREFSSPLRLYTVPFIKVGRRIRKKLQKALGFAAAK